MHDPIQYLCGIEDAEKIRSEALAYNVRILSVRHVPFLDGTSKPQFTVEVDGVRGFLVPASDEAKRRQRLHGRYLKPYNFVVA
jgi:hypothetical protein